ncbi:MAG TPA: D-2-hydroxyacid dehydrogenase [Syntrophorhabdales bacterium]|nr:D-2-hydroxyacid dehydrogenase [Syntrophorhabdales bacterium]
MKGSAEEMYILLAMPDAEDYHKDLREKFPDLQIHAVTSEEGIRPHADKVDILITLYRVADDILKQTTNLKWIQVITSGVNYLLSRPSLRKDIIITSGRGIHGPQVSEMAILLMLALNRNFPENVRNQDKRAWVRWKSKLLYQKNVAIVGVGVIGEQLARKCKAFGMTVYGIDIVKRDLDCVDFFYGPEDLLNVAGEVDYLVLVAPSTPETQKIAGKQLLAKMKPTAFLLNVARGELVDDAALMEALDRGQIAGAALDALSTEPLPADHPLWHAKNLIITPHVAGEADMYRKQIMPIIEENLRKFLSGERRNLVNFIER